MDNKKENAKVKRLTILQAVLGVMVLISGGFVASEIVDGSKGMGELDNMAMASDSELVDYQETINKMQEDGVAVSDPFNTERLNTTGTRYLGRIHIPKIGVNEAIVLGTSGEDLKRGVGVMEGSDIPLGSKGESSIVVGHRGYLLRSEFFWNLDELAVGDKVEVKINDGTLNYEVIKISTIKEDEVEKVLMDEGRTLLALVTSNPFWVTEDRLLVEAELVE